MSADPQRLLSDPASSAKLSADLELARAAGVSGLDLAAGATRLRGAIAAEPAVVGASSAAGASVASKLVIGALAIGGLVGAIALGERVVSRDGQTPDPAVIASTDPVASLEPSSKLGLQRPAIEVPADADEPEPEPDEPVEDDELDEPEPQERPAVIALRERGASLAVKRKVPARRVSEPASPDHRREAELVAKARRSLTGDPERAWQLTEQLGKEFPHGVLAEERDAIAIRALVALGRTRDAQRLAKTFLAEHGEGPHADAIRRAVGL